MFEELKRILGEAYHDGITIEQINEFFKGKNYVNLGEGKYVDKQKYNDLLKDHNSLKENTKDYETLKTENQNYKEKEQMSGYMEIIKKNNVDDKFSKFVYSEVEKNDKFEENLKNYLKDNPQYTTAEQDIVKVNSGLNLTGKNSDNGQDVNAQMNNIFRAYSRK